MPPQSITAFDGATSAAVQEPTAGVRVVGLDLSLTATGTALIRPGMTTAVQTLKSKGAKDATLSERADRLRKLAREILLPAATANVVVIEQPAYSQTGGSHHDRSGLWWLVVDALIFDDLRLVEVTPQAVKIYATGKGNASKDEVLAAVVRRYPDIEVRNNNEADALVLAAIGARLSGQPLEESLPQLHLRALDKIRWTA